MRSRRWLAGLLLAALSAAKAQQPVKFEEALPGYRYEFPRDYFNHESYQTEWWYYTGNLHTSEGRKFGFELTFFRQGVSRGAQKTSVWELNDVYFAHFAVSDLDGKRFLHAEHTNREGPGIAGASETQGKIWNGNWSVTREGGAEKLAAVAAAFAVELGLKPLKPPVTHGENGVSQKSAGAGHASHYFSETRLEATGSLIIDGKRYQLTGLAWMDHEFFTHQLEANQVGWDWVSLQLSDHTELMLFRIRRRDGSADPFSAGTFVDAQGHGHHLSANQFEMEPMGETWVSTATGAPYPVRWKFRVPPLGLELEATTPLASQEMVSPGRIAPSYWEGAIFSDGKKGAEPIAGSGYLEMTGYDRPVEMGELTKEARPPDRRK